MKNNRGEIATVIAIGTLIILGISSLVSSALLKNKQTTRTKAAEDSCECVKYGDKYIYADKPGGGGCTTKYEECTPSVQTSCANKLDQVGACNPACCQSDDDCKGSANQPQPQVCGVPNGYCLSGKSCAAVEPTSKKAKYVRMCLGASCSWTFCDGKNADPSICTEDPNTATNSDPSTLCDSNEECQTFKPTSAAGVNKCINPAGKQENCPRTYSQCYGNGKAMTVHLDCTQSNTSGCVYWCESKSGGRTGCDKSDAKTFDEPSCKAAALPTVTPTSAVSQKKDGTEGSICGTKTGITCKPGFSCNRSENGICVKTSEQQPTAPPAAAPAAPGVTVTVTEYCPDADRKVAFCSKDQPAQGWVKTRMSCYNTWDSCWVPPEAVTLYPTPIEDEYTMELDDNTSGINWWSHAQICDYVVNNSWGLPVVKNCRDPQYLPGNIPGKPLMKFNKKRGIKTVLCQFGGFGKCIELNP